jgi:3-hydroxyisobutyrate dehydrogenase-like beta-hydroxyacid dehydrogenase
LASDEGAEACATTDALCASFAAAGPGVWFSAVTDGDALNAVCFGDGSDAGAGGGVVPRLPVGSVHVCLGTIGTATAEALAERHREAGQHFVACPVFGRPDEAWAGDLTAIVGVSPDLPAPRLDAVRQVLTAFAPRVFEVPGPAAAYAVKLAGNGLIASAVAALTEALSLVRAHGVDAALAHQVFTAKLFRGPVYEGVGQAIGRSVERVAAGEHAPADAPGFTIALGLKDLRLADDAAHASGVAMPMADAARGLLAAADDAGRGGRDWGTLAEALAPQSVTKR